MVTSMFSIFDPCVSYTSFQFKWLISLSWMMVMTVKFMNLDYVKLYYLVVSNFFISSSKTLLKSSYKVVSVKIVSVFTMILMCNQLSMVPFVFGPTSHLSFNSAVALSSWLAGIITMLLISFKDSVSHFVPLGSPMFLTPFLFIVEVISCLIRPVALSVRLMSNMMAGHIIIVLLSNLICSLNSYYLIPIESFIFLFELCISIVQAYVFSSLLALYYKENMMV
nr:ATP synthase F0 subunit 6 [Ibidoecus bisignatus]